MCTVLITYNTCPGFHLVVAANRDEFVARPTAPLGFWDGTNILAGRDLEAGGTWLGVTASGKFGVITNFREPMKAGQYSSRGEIISNFLKGEEQGIDYAERLMSVGSSYRGFNAVLGDRHGLYYCSNRDNGVRQLDPGIYGLSNHLLDTPWPKVERGKRRFAQLAGEDTIDIYRMFELLNDRHSPSPELLPDTGVGREWEMLLGSIFITSPSYGTRSSAVITISKDMICQFFERSFGHSSSGWNQLGERHFQFSVGEGGMRNG